MSDNPEHPDFNWVKARYECSLGLEFECLRKDIERCRDEWAAQQPQNGVGHKIVVSGSPEVICVERRTGSPRRPASVRFVLHADYILVDSTNSVKQFKLTLTLNDEGDCRYRIDGDGEFIRWQVLHRALEPLLFGPAG